MRCNDSSPFTPSCARVDGLVDRMYESGNFITEGYPILSYKGDVDLEKHLVEWTDFYNYHRPHGAHDG